MYLFNCGSGKKIYNNIRGLYNSFSKNTKIKPLVISTH